MNKLNVALWKKEVVTLEANIREMKKRRTESHQPNWFHGSDDWRFTELKNIATAYYMLRAKYRGKQHCKLEEHPLLKQLESKLVIEVPQEQAA
jgi:hypothetical protein